MEGECLQFRKTREVERLTRLKRWISSNWDVEDLEKRKDEIVKDGLLKMVLTGKFGPEQFQ